MILVSGAAGRCGGAVARALLARGAPVRLLVRRPESVRELADAGAEIVRADFRDSFSLARAFRGVAGAFLVTSPTDGFDNEVAAGRSFIAAATAAHVAYVVFQSVIYADTEMPHCATKRAIELALAESHIPSIALRTGNFLEEVLSSPVPWSSPVATNLPLYWTAIADIGEIAASLLSGPPLLGSLPLVCAEKASFDDLAMSLSRAMSQVISCVHVNVSTRALFHALVERKMLSAGEAERHMATVAAPDDPYYSAMHRPISLDPTPLFRHVAIDLEPPPIRLERLVRDAGGKRRSTPQ